jgi:hypothetical protein
MCHRIRIPPIIPSVVRSIAANGGEVAVGLEKSSLHPQVSTGTIRRILSRSRLGPEVLPRTDHPKAFDRGLLTPGAR